MSSRIRSKAILKAAGLAVFAAMFCVGCGDKNTGGDDDVTFTVTFDPDYDDLTPTVVTTTRLPNMLVAPISLPAPTRDGYTFRGWYPAKGGHGYEFTGPYVAWDTTFYAHWTLAHYKVTFDAHGGDVTPAYDTTGDNWKLASLPVPTRAYHDFVGWYKDVVGEREKVEDTTAYKENTILYAHWIYNCEYCKHYTITFDVNGDGGTVDPESEETDAGGILEELPWPERDGYAFIGWFTEKTGGEPITTSYEFSEAATIYAQWKAIADNMYKVTFSAHDGIVTPAFGMTGEDGKLLTGLPMPKRDGHAFQGWFSEDGEVTAGTVFTAHTTIHARWAMIHYTITLDATGGTVMPTTVTTGTHWELDSLPTPKRDGYTFIGWYTEEAGGTHVMPRSTALIDVRVIYAHWAEKPTSLVDSRDGKTYRTVAIGEQIWMAENLNYAGETGSEIGVCYDHDAERCEKSGRLYSWDEAMAACPVGWRLPTDGDWAELLDFIGGTELAGKKLKSTTGWDVNGNRPIFNGTDDYGFSALPGGMYEVESEWFGRGNSESIWWSATTSDYDMPFIFAVTLLAYASLTDSYGSPSLTHGSPLMLISVRCMQD